MSSSLMLLNQYWKALLLSTLCKLIEANFISGDHFLEKFVEKILRNGEGFRNFNSTHFSCQA